MQRRYNERGMTKMLGMRTIARHGNESNGNWENSAFRKLCRAIDPLNFNQKRKMYTSIIINYK